MTSVELSALSDSRNSNDRTSVYDQMEALAGLVSRLPTELLKETLGVAQQIRDADYRAWALAGLLPHLPENLWEEALALARRIHEEELVVASQIHDANARKDLLSGLRALPLVLTALGGPLTITETFRAIQDVGRWWP